MITLIQTHRLLLRNLGLELLDLLAHVGAHGLDALAVALRNSCCEKKEKKDGFQCAQEKKRILCKRNLQLTQIANLLFLNLQRRAQLLDLNVCVCARSLV